MQISKLIKSGLAIGVVEFLFQITVGSGQIDEDYEFDKSLSIQSNLTNLAFKSCLGYELGKYVSGNNSSTLETVIASAVGGVIINGITHIEIQFSEGSLVFEGLFHAIIKNPSEAAKTAISSALIAYINYEEETNPELEVVSEA